MTAVVFRGVELDAPAGGDEARCQGGWIGAPVYDPDLAATLYALALEANRHLGNHPLVGHEVVCRHRHPVGSRFPLHVDRYEDPPPHLTHAYGGEAIDLDLLTTRRYNVVAMVQPAERGGDLIVAGNVVDLDPGDVAVFDSTHPHEVTRVDAGERVVLVTHVHDGA